VIHTQDVHFDLLADQPDAVAKMRELVLDLAVRGRLGTRELNDDPVQELCDEIVAERKSLIRRGVLPGSSNAELAEVSDGPFDIPETWRWMRLEDVFYSVAISDKKIKSSAIQPGGTYPVVDQGKEFIAGYSNEGENLVRIPGPVIIFGDHTCGVKFVDFDFVPGADGIKVLRPICCHEQYFYWVLRSVKVEERGYSRHFKYLLQHQFPLPPLAEQRRIVAKVDELMALCDELAARQQARHAARAQLQQSALHHLLAARDPHTFVPAWQRVRDNFHLLHDTPDAIPQLRQAILQLAVQGRWRSRELTHLRS